MVRLYFFPLLLVAMSSVPLLGQCVRFDVAHSIAAHDVSTPEFQELYPDEKLIQIVVPVSSLLASDESSLELFYVLSGSKTHPFQVVDYAPKTTLTTDVEGLISSEISEDDSTSLGIHALSPIEFPIKTDATAKFNRGTRSQERLERLPPKQLLLTSGTMHRGLSTYFKFRPSTQTTLEGHRMLEVTARVNRAWRASLLHLQCSASKRAGGGKSAVCARQQFLVGIFLRGDGAAKSRVEDLVVAQQQLLDLARTHADTIEERRFPGLAHKLGAAFSVVKPKIPDGWLSVLLTSSDYHRFERHLPQSVRAAATEYRQARAEVIGFAG